MAIAATTIFPPEERATDMALPRDREARVPTTTDASKLSFPLQLVIVIVTAFAAMWASTYSLRSDVRDILTRMEAQGKLVELQSRALEERMNAQKDDINEMKRRLELVQLQYQSLRETMIENRPRR